MSDCSEAVELRHRFCSRPAEMERGHKCRLEDLFINAAYPEVWFLDLRKPLNHAKH